LRYRVLLQGRNVLSSVDDETMVPFWATFGDALVPGRGFTWYEEDVADPELERSEPVEAPRAASSSRVLGNLDARTSSGLATGAQPTSTARLLTEL
jgi:hypothetical protein